MSSSATTSSTGDWSDQETLLLLEGLEMYEEDWARIAQHVGSRSKEQCVMRFLQLPIEEPYLESSAAQTGPLQFATPPYSQAESPVMSVVAFLASAVSPQLAASSAQSSLEQLRSVLAQSSTAAGSNGTMAQTQNGDSDIQQQNADNDDNSSEPSAIKRAALVAFGASAAKADMLGSHEGHQLESLLTDLVSAQMEKLELKISQFNELEQILEHERVDIDVAKQELYLQGLAHRRSLITASEAPDLTSDSTQPTEPPTRDDPEGKVLQI